MSEWQPIETAPKDGTVILISDGKFVEAARWDADDDEFPWLTLCEHSKTNGRREGHYGPAFWRVLPAPPPGDPNDKG